MWKPVLNQTINLNIWFRELDLFLCIAFKIRNRLSAKYFVIQLLNSNKCKQLPL